MREDDTALDDLVKAIIAGDAAGVSHRLAALPGLARARFDKGATRQDAQAFFLKPIERYIVAGDTALHIAAAAYQAGIARELIRSGAHVAAENRFGDQPLHAAALGNPNSPRWNPPAQVATIECLIEAGADPNAADKRGVTPLHKAVRTRSAPAVRSLLAHGADPELRNKSGSTPLRLAHLTTGRGGSGSPQAKAQQEEIVRLLQDRISTASR